MFGPAEVLDPRSSVFWLRVGAAILCGGIIGLERQLRGKAAGIRTSILVCLGTYLFVEMGASLGGERADPTRVLGQVVTGIGFLGGGVILARKGMLLGVTSAAVIWVLAAIGSTIGLGRIAAAMVLSLVTVLVLVGVEFLEATFKRLSGGLYREERESHELEK